jgi:hypothetical protein
MRSMATVVACAIAVCAMTACAGQRTGVVSAHDPRCLRARGCPPPDALAACASADAPSVAAALGSAADGDRVAMRGRLAPASMVCSQVSCPGRCCNHCSGNLWLYGDDRHVELVGARMELAGDDSIVCYVRGEPGQEVIARGKLHRLSEGDLQILVDDVSAP